MKKISKRHYFWLIRTNQRIWSKIGGKGNEAFLRKGGRKTNLSLRCQINLPKFLSLEKCYINNFIDCIKEIRLSIVKKNNMFVDFRPIEKLTPSAALIIAAEIDRWRIKRKIRLRPLYKESWHPSVVKIFSQFKLFDLLNIRQAQKIYDYDDTKFIPMTLGFKADGYIAIKIKKMLEKIIGIKLNTQSWYIALSEAMTNVAQHAYEGKKEKIYIGKAWWISGAYSVAEKKLTVMFYDQGVTIPGSLPFSPKWKMISFLLPENKTDADQIEAAFEVGVSKTHQKNRGKGVAQLLEPIQQCSHGELLVISRYGVCHKVINNGELNTDTYNNDAPLEGTFIEWTIFLGRQPR